MSEEAERITTEDDYVSQVLWRSARARALAVRDPQTALTLAKDAVARAAAADDPVNHGNALLSLAEVLEAAGRWQEAVGAAQEAIALFEAKGAKPTFDSPRSVVRGSLGSPTATSNWLAPRYPMAALAPRVRRRAAVFSRISRSIRRIRSSRRRRVSSARSTEVRPGLSPRSISAWMTQRRSGGRRAT